MNLDIILSKWARLGAFLNAEPAKQTPDIEKLLIETSELCPQMPRLFTVCVTWLTRYDRLVCRHRLARMASNVADPDIHAVLGLMLSVTKQHTGTNHFNLAIKSCKATDISKPLYASDRISEKLSQLAKNRTCDLGSKWGLWCEDVQLKEDTVRPLNWLMDQNPELQQRALFGGNLRASILETLRFCPDAGQSESALARYCYATRKAVREALDHLEFCQLIQRIHDARKVRIILKSIHLKQSA